MSYIPNIRPDVSPADVFESFKSLPNENREKLIKNLDQEERKTLQKVFEFALGKQVTIPENEKLNKLNSIIILKSSTLETKTSSLWQQFIKGLLNLVGGRISSENLMHQYENSLIKQPDHKKDYNAILDLGRHYQKQGNFERAARMFQAAGSVGSFDLDNLKRLHSEQVEAALVDLGMLRESPAVAQKREAEARKEQEKEGDYNAWVADYLESPNLPTFKNKFEILAEKEPRAYYYLAHIEMFQNHNDAKAYRYLQEGAKKGAINCQAALARVWNKDLEIGKFLFDQLNTNSLEDNEIKNFCKQYAKALEEKKDLKAAEEVYKKLGGSNMSGIHSDKNITHDTVYTQYKDIENKTLLSQNLKLKDLQALMKVMEFKSGRSLELPSPKRLAKLDARLLGASSLSAKREFSIGELFRRLFSPKVGPKVFVEFTRAEGLEHAIGDKNIAALEYYATHGQPIAYFHLAAIASENNDYQETMKYLRAGAHNGNLECQRELVPFPIFLDSDATLDSRALFQSLGKIAFQDPFIRDFCYRYAAFLEKDKNNEEAAEVYKKLGDTANQRRCEAAQVRQIIDDNFL